MAENKDARVDFKSQEFNPIHALNSDNVELPYPFIRPLNNLAEYKSLMTNKRQGTSKKKKAMDAIVERRTKIEQMQINNSEPQKPNLKKKITILSLMSDSFEKGPLSKLKECVKNKTKVKIWTRNHSEIRGTMAGYLIAFDKHWNLALCDVDETWQVKPKKFKSPILSDLNLGSLSLTESKKEVPKFGDVGEQTDGEKGKPGRDWHEGHGTGKVCMKHRHVNQLFVRGDNVVMVAVMPL